MLKKIFVPIVVLSSAAAYAYKHQDSVKEIANKVVNDVKNDANSVKKNVCPKVKNLTDKGKKKLEAIDVDELISKAKADFLVSMNDLKNALKFNDNNDNNDKK